MATCSTVQTIAASECIGDSLTKINNNFANLNTDTCNLFTIVNNANTFKNKLINAQGLINQRGYVSGTATTTSNQYTVDRWRVVTSGQNLAFTTSQNVVTFTAPAGGVEQVIEGQNIETGTYVLNWNGTAIATVNGTPRTKEENFTLTGGSNVTVRFTNGTFSLPQLEKNTAATLFEYRPIGTEISLCQRYYEKSYDIEVSPGTVDTSSNNGAELYEPNWVTTGTALNWYMFAYFKVTKRVVPTTAVYSPGSSSKNYLWDANSSANRPAWPASATRNRAVFAPSGSASSYVNAAGQSWFYTGGDYYYHWTADAEIY